VFPPWHCAVAALGARSRPKKARDKIVDLNKQALLSYEAKDFETAKTLLDQGSQGSQAGRPWKTTR
jgi:hypothetical protein